MALRLVIAEKPSVAQTIAAALGVKEKKDGYIEGGGCLISWCVGHLVQLAEAAAYGEQYKKWSFLWLWVVTGLSALCFDFRYLLCRCTHNPYALIAHTVKERVKLPPLRVLLWRRFQKELVYGYIVAEH